MSASTPPSGATSRLVFPGAVLAGKYRIEAAIGYGGMGSVWRATHLGLGEEVAVKLVSAELVRSAEGLRRFDAEAKAAARIRSRHVPNVFDNGVLEDGTPYLVMELLRGESLFTRIHRLGPVPLPEAVSIVDQCCRAIARAHSLGIVHRDIKPDNIYLAHSVDDDAYVVKVLDFGIAKFLAVGDAVHSSTRTGALLGTPTYMSPEQARGLRSIDGRSDLYSLGLVTYTMLTGTLAFSAESLGDLLIQICVQPLPKLRATAAWLPPAMEDWFQKACAREPGERYPSAAAFIDALRLAAGISAPAGGVEAAAFAGAGAGGSPLASPAAGAAVPRSTTAGTSLGASVDSGRRTRQLVIASSVIGLAVGVLGVSLVARTTRTSESHAPSPASAPGDRTRADGRTGT
ncbi:MAG: serine/threonine protein kinase, partial [Myxococcota bacterium]|nr:serine/threonine protein kinase [Myxococcota bacterium]